MFSLTTINHIFVHILFTVGTLLCANTRSHSYSWTWVCTCHNRVACTRNLHTNREDGKYLQMQERRHCATQSSKRGVPYFVLSGRTRSNDWNQLLDTTNALAHSELSVRSNRDFVPYDWVMCGYRSYAVSYALGCNSKRSQVKNAHQSSSKIGCGT